MKNRKLILILFLLPVFFTACKQKAVPQEKTVQADTLLTDIDREKEVGIQPYDSLLAQLPNRVSLDTLLMNRTNQQNVKILAELNEEENSAVYPDPQALITTYSGGGYSFRIKTKEPFENFPDNKNDENTILYDGKKKIVFRDYKVTCYNNKDFDCDDFGFNSYHYLGNPKIIEVCGKKFLYSELGFACNGMGCGQQLTMIYDLAEKKPTFVGNFRLDFDGFLLSDFNNDGIPDLLVTAKTPVRNEKEPSFGELDMVLLAYEYDKGAFRLKNKSVIHLYGIGAGYGMEPHFSIKQDNWFENEIRNKPDSMDIKIDVP